MFLQWNTNEIFFNSKKESKTENRGLAEVYLSHMAALCMNIIDCINEAK